MIDVGKIFCPLHILVNQTWVCLFFVNCLYALIDEHAANKNQLCIAEALLFERRFPVFCSRFGYSASTSWFRELSVV